jgi:hypothetical protein
MVRVLDLQTPTTTQQSWGQRKGEHPLTDNHPPPTLVSKPLNNFGPNMGFYKKVLNLGWELANIRQPS